MTGEDLKQLLEAARARHRTWLPLWAEQMAFWQGRQFVWRSSRNVLNEQPVAPDARHDPWRARTVRNRIFKIVNGEVSAGTNRTPGYEVTPTTTSPEDIGAARLAEKVLLYLYDHLQMRRHITNAYRFAVVTGEGFVRPYWNNQVGAELPEGLREGQLALEVYSPDQVFWEAGLTFTESRWHAIDRAMSVHKAKRLPGYNGAELKTDTQSHASFVSGQLSKKSATADAVTVTEFLELPCPEYPQGRRFYWASGKQITETEPYPLMIEGDQGYEPVLHKLSYIETPDRDRDMGLVEHLIDAQRTMNDAINKQIEWKNLALNPQGITGPAGMIDPLTNEPGAIFRVKGDPRDFQWRPVPQVPPELQTMIHQAVEDMEEISAQRSVPSQVESGKAIAAILERDDSVRAHIVQNLADFWSRLGRHQLHFVQKHYTERRLIQVNGRLGAEYIDFKGANLRDQVGVRVLPGSIEPRTKQAIEQKVFAMADRGWITPDQAMRAINNGTAEQLVDDADLDVSKQQREIQQMVAMGDDNLPGGDAPIAGEFDKHSIHRYELHKWMKTVDFDRQHDLVKEAAKAHDEQHKVLEEQAAFEEAQRQTQMAEQLGMQNAAKPQGAKPMPDQLSPNGGGPSTPNQPSSQALPS